jgi:hypothetical protein
MNFRSTTALAAFLASGLAALPRADAAPTNNALLNGEYIGEYTKTCLVTILGFNERTLQPNVPDASHVASDAQQAIWNFNGRGSVTETGTVVYIPSVAAEPSSVFTPGASGSTQSGDGKYTVTGNDEVNVTISGEAGKFTAGKNKGLIFTVSRYTLAGHASGDGATVILATPEPAVETTANGGKQSQRICERSVVLLKKH